MTAAATAALKSETVQSAPSPLTYRLAGLAFATVLPALFWVAIAAWAGRAAGVEFSSTAMITAGTAIAAFLGSVCAPIVLKS